MNTIDWWYDNFLVKFLFSTIVGHSHDNPIKHLCCCPTSNFDKLCVWNGKKKQIFSLVLFSGSSRAPSRGTSGSSLSCLRCSVKARWRWSSTRAGVAKTWLRGVYVCKWWFDANMSPRSGDKSIPTFSANLNYEGELHCMAELNQ